MNFTGFPLYSTLYKEIDDTPVSSEEKQFFITYIKKLDKQEHEYIYALILSYYLDSIQKNPKEIPYMGKEMKSGYKFNMEDLPPKLQKIICKFAEKDANQKGDKKQEKTKKRINIKK